MFIRLIYKKNIKINLTKKWQKLLLDKIHRKNVYDEENIAYDISSFGMNEEYYSSESEEMKL